MVTEAASAQLGVPMTSNSACSSLWVMWLPMPPANVSLHGSRFGRLFRQQARTCDGHVIDDIWRETKKQLSQRVLVWGCPSEQNQVDDNVGTP